MSKPQTQIDTARPAEVAEALGTTELGLAQMRYRGTGPKFVRIGGPKRGKILYRWSDVREYLDAKTCKRTTDTSASIIDSLRAELRLANATIETLRSERDTWRAATGQ